MKASDISDELIYSLIAAREPVPGSLYDLQDQLQDRFPRKVVYAKCYQMVNKGRLLGCKCGCRGNFKIPRQIADAAVEDIVHPSQIERLHVIK